MYQKGDAPSAVPIYMQISEVLMREIAAGHLVDGQRLPPERDLAQQHGTTVRTLRKALAVLERKGLLERVHGSGNYVRASTIINSIYSMFRLELIEGGGLPTAQVLDIKELEKPADLPLFGTSARGTRMRRLRFLNQIPIAVEEIWLDRDAGKVNKEDVADSLYRYYKMHLGFWITRAEDFVSISPVPQWAPQEFGKAASEIAGFIERISFSDEKGSVEYSKTWFDPNKARYVQRFQ